MGVHGHKLNTITETAAAVSRCEGVLIRDLHYLVGLISPYLHQSTHDQPFFQGEVIQFIQSSSRS